MASGALPEPWAQALELQPGLFHSHQYWRLFSAHFVHFGLYHSLMNGAALALVLQALAAGVPLALGLRVLGLCALAVGLGMALQLQPQEAYRGFSGVFCGLLAFGLLWHMRPTTPLLMFFYAGLVVKIGLEQLPQYNVDYLRGLMDFSVAVNAHAYGAACGSVAALYYRLRPG